MSDLFSVYRNVRMRAGASSHDGWLRLWRAVAHQWPTLFCLTVTTLMIDRHQRLPTAVWSPAHAGSRDYHLDTFSVRSRGSGEAHSSPLFLRLHPLPFRPLHLSPSSPLPLLISPPNLLGWRRGSVVRTSVFGWRTFPELRLIYGWHVATSLVRCTLWVNQVNQLGQLSLPSLWGR